MTSTTPKGKKLPQDHLDAAEQALTTVTENPTPKTGDDPKAHLHAPAAKEESHTWFRSIFPYNSLEEFENAWHMGNYVLDRKTGMKSFEEMSIYVRVGVLQILSVQPDCLTMTSLECTSCTMAPSKSKRYTGSEPKTCFETKA